MSEITASGNIRRIKRDLGRHRAPGTGDHAAADALELLLVLPLAPAHSLGLLVCMAAWSATVAIAAAARILMVDDAHRPPLYRLVCNCASAAHAQQSKGPVARPGLPSTRKVVHNPGRTRSGYFWVCGLRRQGGARDQVSFPIVTCAGVAAWPQTCRWSLVLFACAKQPSKGLTMNKILLSSIALAAFTAGASAADLPPRYAPPAAFAPVPLFTWTGFYVGVNAGYGWSSNDGDCFCGGDQLLAPSIVGGPGGGPGGIVPIVPEGGGSFAGVGNLSRGNRDGFIGGGQVGVNYQFTPGSGFVVGLEADIQWADLGGNNNNGFFGGNIANGFGTAAPGGPESAGFGTVAGAPGAGFGLAGVAPRAPGNVAFFNNFGNNFGRRDNGDWFATVRGRLGYAFDRVLVYGTAGAVFTDNGNNNDGFFAGTGLANGAAVAAASPAFYTNAFSAAAGARVAPESGFLIRKNNNDWGWVLGAGVEYAWTNNLTVKLEGLWVNLDSNNNNNFAFNNTVVGVTNKGAPITRAGLGFGRKDDDAEFFVARVGVNWKFGL